MTNFEVHSTSIPYFPMILMRKIAGRAMLVIYLFVVILSQSTLNGNGIIEWRHGRILPSGLTALKFPTAQKRTNI